MRALCGWSLVGVAVIVSACGAKSQTLDDVYEPRPCAIVDAGPADAARFDAGDGERDLGRSDAGLGDAAPSDAASSDAGDPDLGAVCVERDAGAPPNVDVVGAWHGCSERYDFAVDGRYVRSDLRRACETSGVYAVAGRMLTIEVDRDTCVPAAVPSVEYEASLGAGGLLLVGAEGRVVRLANDATPRLEWSVVGETNGAPGSTTLRVVDPARGPYSSACYWSADRRCGGLFSCGGSVLNWRISGAEFLAQTTCDGPCPCVAMSVGSVDPDGTVRATFNAVTCRAQSAGSFTATPSDG